MDDLVAPYTGWTAACCDMLHRCAEVDGDYALTYLVRLASYTNAANQAIHENNGTSQQQSELVLLGLELQDRELRQNMLPHLASSGTSNWPKLLIHKLMARSGSENITTIL